MPLTVIRVIWYGDRRLTGSLKRRFGSRRVGTERAAEEPQVMLTLLGLMGKRCAKNNM